MSRSSSSSQNRSGSKAFGMSSYSINKSGPMNRIAKNNLKEELISKKITEIFKDKEQRMIRTIEATIVDDKLKVYKQKRSEYEDELNDLEKERVKIIKRKKNKKEKMKALRMNARQQMCYLVKALNDTVLYYKILYYENDFYRLKRLLDMAAVEKTQTLKMKTVQELLNNLFHSPFKDDRRFMIKYLAIETRDRLNESKHLIDSLFFDKIFKLMLTSSDEQNTLQAYDIICNLMMNNDYRAKMREGGYVRQIYESVNLEKIEEKKLEKVSHMTTLLAFHTDMLQRILDVKLLPFIIKLVDPKYSVTIRSNAVLAISLLTYHEILFQELIANNVIDMIMDLCMDPKQEISIKRFSTLALVHFALSRDSIQLLLEKGIMNLFNALSTIDNAQIHTNVSWIFLALCNNGITGKQMLMNGITRDMFLVSCNPQFSQIRHLVIAGFAELGRCDNLQEQSMRVLPHTLQRIKEKAIVGTQEAYKRSDAPHTIDVLLRFTLSEESQYKQTAFWALKDYILLNNEQLVEDLKGVICAFVNGAAEVSDKVKAESATAISFLITHHKVFTEEEAKDRQDKIAAGKNEYEFNEDLNFILDALMYLTGQEALEVRTKAFSTLSSLSTYASQNEHVMAQIQNDIKMRPGMQSNDYFSFIEERLAKSQKAFREKFETKGIEKDYAGLYCLLRLAQEPDEAGTEEAARYLRHFYFPDLAMTESQQVDANFLKTGGQGTANTKGERASPSIGPQSVQYQDTGGENPYHTEQLTEEEKRLLSVNMFNDELDERELVLDELNEKFFMYVFKALLYSKNRRILYQLLDVINFYIKHDTPYQKDVINPNTILWMLQIIDTHKEDGDLCLLAAKTVLKVVNNHQIVFDYQEMAIIKKFNKALDNIGGDATATEDGDGPLKLRMSIGGEELQSARNRSTGKQSLNHTPEENASPAPNDINIKVLDPQGESIQNQDQDESFDSEKFSQAIDAYSKHHASRQEKSSQDPSQKREDLLEEMTASMGKIQSAKTLKQIEEDADRHVEKIMKTQVAQESQNSHQHMNLVQESASFRSSKQRRIFSDRSPQLKANEQGTVAISHDQPEQIDEKQAELRDAIIKSFMVIFTNEKSQHLLLNKDIIEIAFSCLENVFQISTEAKQNLARLISIIFKFPQVQDRLLNEGIILGIVYLLQMPDIHKSDILHYIVTACSYISLNFKFVNSRLSLHILKALVPILNLLLQMARQQQIIDDQVGSSQHTPQRSKESEENIMPQSPNKAISSAEAYLEQRLQSQITTPIDKRREKDNCIFALQNLLKGHPENASYFIQCDGAQLIMHEVMRVQSQTNSAVNREILELTMCCIKQVTEQKRVFRQFLSFSEENLNLLPQCLEKCFTISDSWYTCTSEIVLFKKLFTDGEKYYEGEAPELRAEREEEEKRLKRLNSEQIQNIDYKNIERLKMLEKLEEKEDKSFVMAPLCKMRNHCYIIAASAFRNSFSQEFLLMQCNILHRIIEDLKKNDLNDFIFQNLIDILRALKKDKQAIRSLFANFAPTLISLIKTDMENSISKRLSLIKTMVYLILKAPDELSNIDPAIFGQFFKLAVDVKDEQVIENILWLQAALIEINSSEEQQMRAIEMCTEFKSAQIYAQCLLSTNEAIVLQSLKGLKSLAAIPQFKAIILIDIGDQLFPSLADILSTRLSTFTVCPLEIEVELIGFLAQITESSAATKDPLTVAAKRRAVQQGFMEHFLMRISTIEYVVVQDIDMLSENCAEISNLDLMNVGKTDGGSQLASNVASSDNGGLTPDEMQHLEDGGDFTKCEPLPYFDGIDREDGTNRLVENTIDLAANVTELAETHENLVHGRSQILKQAMALLNHVVEQCIEVESEQVDMLNYSIGNRQICNSLSKILLNLCMSVQGQAGAPSIQDVCVENSVGSLMVHVCRSLIDYELHSNLYRAMCLLALSPNQDNRTHFVESDCLNDVQQASENNRYFRVRRTCIKALDQVSSELFELNEKNNRKKRKARRRQTMAANQLANQLAASNIQAQQQEPNIVNIS